MYKRKGKGGILNKKGQGEIIGAGFIILVAGIIIACMLGFDSVDATHLGVMNNMGTIKGVMQPGFRWTGFFTHVEEYDLRLRQMTVEMMDAEKTSIDHDGQTIKARIQINYRLNPESIISAYTKVGLDRDLAETLNIEGIIREGFKTATAEYSSTEIWQKRGEVKDKAIKIIEANFPKEYFNLDNVVISDIDFNPAFIAAIEQQKTNEKLALAKEKEVDIAKFEADRKVAEQKGISDAAKLQYEAEAYKTLTLAQAEAQALKLKKEQLTPLMIQQSYIEAWKAGGAQVPKIVMGDAPGLLMQMPSMSDLEGMK
jgi:regulator of protease activity HflC (stomatin/prohibitin superfamily)